MAALAFLLAPADASAISEGYDDDWFDRCYTWIAEAWLAWRERLDAMPDAERPRAARAFDFSNISTNFRTVSSGPALAVVSK